MGLRWCRVRFFLQNIVWTLEFVWPLKNWWNHRLDTELSKEMTLSKIWMFFFYKTKIYLPKSWLVGSARKGVGVMYKIANVQNETKKNLRWIQPRGSLSITIDQRAGLRERCWPSNHYQKLHHCPKLHHWYTVLHQKERVHRRRKLSYVQQMKVHYLEPFSL